MTPVLEQTTEMNLLYDFYGLLLTERQRTLLELYYHDDWSLGEIAEHQGVSRQAVFEAIKRAQATLTDLEEKLGLLQKHLKRQKIAEELLQRLEEMPEARAIVKPFVSELVDID
ncbi:YlxM family DNA-binding protein [Paenactinomyces guangxiensis]|uniref:YlxM family DNA-binding protein n=1 Tax=Paenactinomyces guangxiensis TaxID=1490290 RepID=UPI002867D738|nr:putative DNA-binding protein [Paenactinomyces guangxiensis]